MKKIKYILTCLLAFVCLSLTFVFTFGNDSKSIDAVKALSVSDIRSDIQIELEEFIEYGKTDSQKKRASRVPGSKAEYNAGMYLHSELSSLRNFKPVNNASTVNGIERFEFESVYDGNTYTSQNIVFKRQSNVSTDKKVIIATHYDTTYVSNDNTFASGKGLVKDGVNDNGASVAVLLTLVKNLDKLTLDYGYDIEVVFFGASTNNYDGSAYFVRGQSDQDIKNTLLMINLDRIALGSYNYAYVNEFKTTQEQYIFNTIENCKKLENKNVLDFSLNSANGLNYTHVGLESDHAKFMARNVNVVSFFSGNYESAITHGLNEYNSGSNVTFTENDSYLYILTNYSNVMNNLSNVYIAVDMLLSDNDFIMQMQKPNGLAGKYDFWTNEKLAVFITAVLLVVFGLVYVLIFRHLKQKSRALTGGKDVDKIVIQITKNIADGEDDKFLSDAIDKKIKSDTDQDDEEN